MLCAPLVSLWARSPHRCQRPLGARARLVAIGLLELVCCDGVIFICRFLFLARRARRRGVMILHSFGEFSKSRWESLTCGTFCFSSFLIFGLLGLECLSGGFLFGTFRFRFLRTMVS